METLKTPFNTIIVGMTACGKTHYLLELFEKECKEHFDNIYLLCPTLSWNKTHQKWRFINDPDFIAVECSQDDIDHFLAEIVYVAWGTNSLLILDHCASGQVIKNRTSELVKLGFSARHHGLSTIVLTQQLNFVSKPFREQISKLVSL